MLGGRYTRLKYLFFQGYQQKLESFPFFKELIHLPYQCAYQRFHFLDLLKILCLQIFPWSAGSVFVHKYT